MLSSLPKEGRHGEAFPVLCQSLFYVQVVGAVNRFPAKLTIAIPIVPDIPTNGSDSVRYISPIIHFVPATGQSVSVSTAHGQPYTWITSSASPMRVIPSSSMVHSMRSVRSAIAARRPKNKRNTE